MILKKIVVESDSHFENEKKNDNEEDYKKKKEWDDEGENDKG